MKKIYWIAGILILAGIGLLIGAAGDMSTYSTFGEATRTGDKVKVVGTLAKDKEMYYDPIEDPNYFSFYVSDNDGEVRKVILRGAKPQDFELSEQIVVTGQMDGQDFMASELLMKCPSKYKDEEVFLRSES
ncbi:MAG: cytochrome c maturation protein CcmE [Lewinellaceae bacterium]|nr:cytochrome c maturation protein CcmE [Saprospiraceae bacterium]MCB9311514.1 cytochrome c maturation protein CcmE [Lewinellaceae bacterium]HRW75373.1 cytochrome c maturation protein CcmE [Saprospiraceae bacterium]